VKSVTADLDDFANDFLNLAQHAVLRADRRPQEVHRLQPVRVQGATEMAVSTSEDTDVLSEINITPLVDVMLVLLVAFVITKFPRSTNAIHINLPRTVQNHAARAAEGHHGNGRHDRGRLFRRRARGAGGIEHRLLNIKASIAEPSLHLRADDRVPYGSVAKVMAAIEHSGISKGFGPHRQRITHAIRSTLPGKRAAIPNFASNKLNW
jgi:biopolymer transport protein ExbD